MSRMKRRDFLKGLAAGGAAAAVATVEPKGGLRDAWAAKKEDIGQVKSLKITCVTETSWFDNATFLKTIKEAGGVMVSQYKYPFREENKGGYSALVEVENLDGSWRKILLDTGFSEEWTDYCFKRAGIDKMLQGDEIEFLFISHEHFDHFWGIRTTMKYNPKIKTYIGDKYYPEGMELYEKSGHKGELVTMEPNKVYKLFPGCAGVHFDVPIIGRVRGETVMYFDVKDKGIVTVTGCCHPGILTLLNYAKRNFKGGDTMYGCYGGLHISVFENWDPKFDDIIVGVKGFNMKKMGCNHCTGWIWCEKAEKAGLPIIHGTNKYRTYPKWSTVAREDVNLYITNGDVIVF